MNPKVKDMGLICLGSNELNEFSLKMGVYFAALRNMGENLC